MADIQRTSLPASELKVGSGSVGLTPIVCTGVGYVGLARGVTIAADPENAGVLYVGGTGGFALKAGMSQLFEIDDSSALMIVASQASQGYSWSAI